MSRAESNAGMPTPSEATVSITAAPSLSSSLCRLILIPFWAASSIIFRTSTRGIPIFRQQGSERQGSIQIFRISDLNNQHPASRQSRCSAPPSPGRRWKKEYIRRGCRLVQSLAPTTLKPPLFTSTVVPGKVEILTLFLVNCLKIVLLPTFGNPISNTFFKIYPFDEFQEGQAFKCNAFAVQSFTLVSDHLDRVRESSSLL